MQIAFYKGKDRVFNKATAWWLRGYYSHCELVLGTNHIGQAICASSSFLDHGVRVKHMTLNPEHCELVDVAGRAEDAWAWIRQHGGQGYDLLDLLGLVGFVLRVLGQGPTRWVRSGAVAAMGRPDAWRLDPRTPWAPTAPGTPLEATGP